MKTFAHQGCKIAAVKKFLRIFSYNLFSPFKHLFTPTSQGPISKLFRFSKLLEKSNGKKWFQVWKLLLIKGVKSPCKKKFTPPANLPYYQNFFGIGATILIGREMLCLLCAGFAVAILFWNLLCVYIEQTRAKQGAAFIHKISLQRHGHTVRDGASSHKI